MSTVDGLPAAPPSHPLESAMSSRPRTARAVASVEPARVPVCPLLSICQPRFLGIDEFGQPVYLSMIYRNILIGGEPGAGKSSLLNTIVGHAALSNDVRLCLLDGKQVELGLWEAAAD